MVQPLITQVNFSVSNYGTTTISGNVVNIESSFQNDVIVGSDNWENIRLYGGEDIITAGDGPDRIRFKLWDVNDSGGICRSVLFI